MNGWSVPRGRLAGELNCEWLAVYVETPEHARISDTERDRIARTLQRVEELGGKTVTLVGSPLHEVLLDYARKNNVTRIIVGKPARPPWQDWLQTSLVYRLIRESGPIDVFVISGEPEAAYPAPVRGFIPHRPLNRYLSAVLLVVAASVVEFFLPRSHRTHKPGDDLPAGGGDRRHSIGTRPVHFGCIFKRIDVRFLFCSTAI